MFQITVQVHGLTNSACGAVIAGKIRRTFPDAKNISASHWNGTVKFVSATEVDVDALRAAIDDTGYRFVGCETIEYERRNPFRRG